MLNRELVSRAVICPRRLGGLLGGEHEAAPAPCSLQKLLRRLQLLLGGRGRLGPAAALLRLP